MKTKGPDLVWAGKEPDNELNGEEDHDKVVDHLDDVHHCRILNIASRILKISHMTPDTRNQTPDTRKLRHQTPNIRQLRHQIPRDQKSYLLQLVCSGDNESDG